MMKKILLIAACLTVIPSIAFAEDNRFAGTYAGVNIGYSSNVIKEASNESSYNINGMTFGGVMGHRIEFLDNILVGAEVNINFDKTKNELIEEDGYKRYLERGTLYGLSGQIAYTQRNNLLFFNLGYGWSTAFYTTEKNGVSKVESWDLKGLHLGTGIEFIVKRHINVRIEGQYQLLRGLDELGLIKNYSIMAGLTYNF